MLVLVLVITTIVPAATIGSLSRSLNFDDVLPEEDDNAVVVEGQYLLQFQEQFQTHFLFQCRETFGSRTHLHPFEIFHNALINLVKNYVKNLTVIF